MSAPARGVGRPLSGDEKLQTIGISLTPTQIRMLDEAVDYMRAQGRTNPSRSLAVRLLIDEAIHRAQKSVRR